MYTNHPHDDHTLVEAYNRMMDSIRNQVKNNKNRASVNLQKAIDQARRDAVASGELSLEEAEDVGHTIMQDINEAAEYLMETSHEFSEWLMLDIEIIEQKVLDLFLRVVETTRKDLNRLVRPRLENKQTYAGRLTAPAANTCSDCGKALNYKSRSATPRCAACQSKHFKSRN